MDEHRADEPDVQVSTDDAVVGDGVRRGVAQLVTEVAHGLQSSRHAVGVKHQERPELQKHGPLRGALDLNQVNRIGSPLLYRVS